MAVEQPLGAADPSGVLVFRMKYLPMALAAVVAVSACGSDEAAEPAEVAETAATVAADEPADEPADDAATDDLSVALLVGGPRDDGGFYQAMVDGLEDAADADGAMEVTVIENIAEGGDAGLEAAVQNAADSGDYDLIVAHGFDLVPGVARYAPDYPDQAFVTSLPVEGADNVAVYLTAFEETGYNAGFLAAQGKLLSGSDGAVGFLGGPGLPFEEQALFGFEQAVEQYAPGTEVVSVFTGTFEDPQLAQETATQMFQQGVVSLWNQQAAGQSGVYQACAATEGVVCFGNGIYSEAVSPDVVLASTTSDYGKLVPLWTERLRAGEWSPAIDILDLTNDGTSVTDATAAGLEALPDLQAAIDDYRAGAADLVVETMPTEG
ncbi:putative nucleoside ABC transporter nucleoside-binding protein [Ilumatobacter coccineus YM16-304]|uniref:Putative nucleoside ABC transporter nucleoside-binding protein n=2 Tax=Ilumatobacter coccineus TaxID=467094 RepID=A0A6C7DZR5_ILUCY|nr:putative nucleoside ABC transporter nucleoside-binding protein [Ilumatobacter coccineus YM16-304]